MISKSLFTLVYICCISNIAAHAFNDAMTHPDLTKAAIKPINSNFDTFIVSNIGYNLGKISEIIGKDQRGFYKRYQIERWLQEGSTDEDAINICRASNHFHNPIHSGDWSQAQMSDSPLWLDAFCGWAKRYSAVTWATGFTSPGAGYIGVRTGQYLGLTGLSDARQDMGWDNARDYFYAALTSPDPVDRDDNFVKTLRAVGQVLHLLQDMAVPAHVRNDMESHLFNASILNADKWLSNPFEKYVVTHSKAINNIPVKPEFLSSTRLTDFWDRNVYTGANPSEGKFQGLAEYANANYFSDYTIPNNKPSAVHTFPYPQITNTNYICTDVLPESGEMTKYVSRIPCPTYRGTLPVDHFAAVSLVNKKGALVTALKKVWLDDNVHDTYAQQILPRAVGYSASLLDYFFRGAIKLNMLESGADSSTIRFTATNIATNGDLMTGGTVALVLRYRQILNSDESATIQNSDYYYKVFPRAGLTDIPAGAGREFVFDISTDPLPDWANDVTAQLVYHGQLGNESGAVAAGMVSLRIAPEALKISLPPSGVYSASTGGDFNRITLNATTGLLGGLTRTDGVFQLLLVHRYSASDPFQSVPISTTPVDPNLYRVIRASEANGISSLQQGVAGTLNFDITDTPLPLWASDVQIYLVYKHVGDPDSKALAVGYLDFAEPTPVDVYNNTDLTCLNGRWYRYDDPAAMAIVDANSNGIADRSDIYPHTISDITFLGGPEDAAVLNASTTNNLSAPGPLLPGQKLRLGYILTDYKNRYTFNETWTNLSSNDSWTTISSPTTFSGAGFTNQAGKVLGGMYTIRGSKMWWGTSVVYVNESYQLGSYCDTELLN